ncbi:MAG: HPF/RaiA family ribosome-associated protein [Bryobacteraceae bacterium]|jgi:cold shock CspA family protein
MLLPVQVTFRNIEDHAGLDDYVQKEAAKLERFYSRISSCRVVVERPQRATSSKLFHVRIDLGVPNEELVVKHIPSLHGTLEDMQTQKSRREAKSVLVHKNPKRAIHEAFQEMGRQLQDYARRQEGAVKTKQGAQEAVVKEISPQQGYGFLETDDGRAVYFHQASVLDGHFPQLRVGTKVHFHEEQGDKGPQASTVKIIHPRKQALSAAALSVLPAKSARK